MYIYAIALFFLVSVSWVFYMTYYKLEVFDGYLSVLDRSLDRGDIGWKVLTYSMLVASLAIWVWTWYQK